MTHADVPQPDDFGYCLKCPNHGDLWYAGDYSIDRGCDICGSPGDGGDRCMYCKQGEIKLEVGSVHLCYVCYQESTGISLGDKCEICVRWGGSAVTGWKWEHPEERSMYSAILTEEERKRYFRDPYEYVRICEKCQLYGEIVSPDLLERYETGFFGKPYDPKSAILEVFDRRATLSQVAVTIVRDIFHAAGYKSLLRGVEQTRPYLTDRRAVDPNEGYIKSMSEPDLEVIDKASKDTRFLEVKATTKSSSNYSYSTRQLVGLIKYHSEAFLLIYHIPSGRIFGRKVRDIPWDSLPIKGTEPDLHYGLQFASHDGPFTDLPTLTSS